MKKSVHVFQNGKLLKEFTADLVDVTSHSLVFFDVPIRHKGMHGFFNRGKQNISYYGALHFMFSNDSCLVSIGEENLIEIEIKYSC